MKQTILEMFPKISIPLFSAPVRDIWSARSSSRFSSTKEALTGWREASEEPQRQLRDLYI